MSRAHFSGLACSMYEYVISGNAACLQIVTRMILHVISIRQRFFYVMIRRTAIVQAFSKRHRRFLVNIGEVMGIMEFPHYSRIVFDRNPARLAVMLCIR